MKKLSIIIIFVAVIGIAGAYMVIRSNQNVVTTQNQNNQTAQLSRFCSSDEDCEEYLSLNTCDVLCANQDPRNEEILSELPVTCDAALWDPPAVTCVCINQQCQRQEGY